jgi:hypothetical protein
VEDTIQTNVRIQNLSNLDVVWTIYSLKNSQSSTIFGIRLVKLAKLAVNVGSVRQVQANLGVL